MNISAIVFCRDISDMATSTIICHIHPSGDVIPSSEDKEVTSRIHKAGKIIGIPLVDHVVFSKTGFTSILKNGEWRLINSSLSLAKNGFRSELDFTIYINYTKYFIGSV